MEARSAWCAFEGRDFRQVLPLLLSFVCSVSRILLALSLPLCRLRHHLFDGQGPEGRLESIQGVLSGNPLAHVRAPPKVQRQVLALPVPQALALSSRRRPPLLDPSSFTLLLIFARTRRVGCTARGCCRCAETGCLLLPEKFIVFSALCFCFSCCLLLL